MSGLAKEVFSAQIWQGAILLAVTAVQLVAARYIGPEGLGVTALIVSSSSFCFLLIELNLHPALVRTISQLTADHDQSLFRADILTGRLVLALVIAPIVAVVAAHFSHGHGATVFIGTIGAVIAQELNPGWWLQGIGQSGKYFRLTGAVALIACPVAISLAYLTRQPGIENLANSLAGIIIYGVFWQWRRSRPVFSERFIGTVHFYASYAWQNKSFLLGGAAVYLYLYPAQLLLASTRSVAEAGFYRVAMMPGVAYYALTVAAFNAYYPRVLRAHGNSIQEFQRILRQIVLMVYGIGVVAWLATMGFRNLFAVVIGDGFDASVALAPAMMISKSIGGVGLVLRAALLAQAKEQLVYIVFFGVGLITLLLNLALIPHFGILGAACVEIGMEVFHLLILLWMVMAFEEKANLPPSRQSI